MLVYVGSALDGHMMIHGLDTLPPKTLIPGIIFAAIGGSGLR